MSVAALCVLLIGPPACGKSTICAEMEKQFKFKVLCPGDMLRQESHNEKSILGKFISHNWNHSALGTVLENMLQRLLRTIDPMQPIVIDGHPRTVDQAYGIGNIVQNRVVCAIYLDNNSKVCEERFFSRKRGGETKESLQIRWTTFEEESPKIIEILKQNNVFYSIDASGPLMSTMQNIQEAMDDAWKKQLQIFPTKLHFPPRYVEPIEAATCIELMISMLHTKRPWKHFNGRHAVTIDRRNMELLGKHPYSVSVKVDGVRVMVVPLYGCLFMVDRALQVHMLCKNENIVNQMGATLLDCEWIEDKNTIIVIDVPFFKNMNVSQKDLGERLRPVEEMCLLLSKENDVKFYPQMYWNVRHVDEVPLDKFPYKHDGFIFTPYEKAYSEGTDYNLLKWKPSNDNSVDLLYDANELWTLHGKMKKSCGFPSIVHDWMKPRMILECRWDWHKQRWAPYRHREDRTSPNPSHIVDSIYKTIQNPITWKDLCSVSVRIPHKKFRQTHESFFEISNSGPSNQPLRKLGYR